MYDESYLNVALHALQAKGSRSSSFSRVKMVSIPCEVGVLAFITKMIVDDGAP
jgi:hypothetical protein